MTLNASQIELQRPENVYVAEVENPVASLGVQSVLHVKPLIVITFALALEGLDYQPLTLSGI